MKQTALQATAIRLPHTILREQTADRFFFKPILAGAHPPGTGRKSDKRPAARHDVAPGSGRVGFLFRAIVHFDDAAHPGRNR